MSLPRHELRALRQIEAGIRRSDPGLAQFLGDFDEAAAGHAGPDRRDVTRRGLPKSAFRLAVRGAAAALSAVCAPGLRERLGVRDEPQPMARSPWQRYT
jgi:Protein of unknown function (DUF3040)